MTEPSCLKVPADFIVQEGEFFHCYAIKEFDSSKVASITMSEGKTGSSSALLLYVQEDNLFYVQNETLFQWNYFTQLLVPLGSRVLCHSVDLKTLSSFDMKVATHFYNAVQWNRFEHPAVIWILIGKQLSPEQMTKGLRAQFNLTDVTVKHSWSHNNYYVECDGQRITLNDLCVLITKASKSEAVVAEI